jgi:4-hydroxy-tetrahydrodipicolinate synthase
MFDSTRIRGVIPAMLTPLTPDERVDEIGVRQLVRFLLERRVHGIFTLGSTGEFTALTPEQRQRHQTDHCIHACGSRCGG